MGTPLPAARRSYSSFFSSKPGGGRYFNPAKPPKVVPPASNKKNSQVDRQQASPGDAVDGVASSSQACDNTHSAAVDKSSEVEEPTATTTKSTFALPRSSIPSSPSLYAHPILGDKDFKLHQFFSLHRPLLLLSNPQSILESAPATHIFSAAPPTVSSKNATSGAPEQVPDVSYEADAETARNLSRALTMSRLGATISWEATLKQLGLDSSEAEKADLREQLDKEYRDVMMDSTKRKRRKKMKKHKLKKRRRLTRQQRHNQR
ncbi:hypothetical protein VNI00_003179 [Paramarasmius palmivorus]|uniref:Ribosomal protein mS38 C-terminal domain-containing protein n=1 Tax=Paramarasmius palmivorus TaxID=297713 RepID=A0AAW0DQ79_9AGAR